MDFPGILFDLSPQYTFFHYFFLYVHLLYIYSIMRQSGRKYTSPTLHHSFVVDFHPLILTHIIFGGKINMSSSLPSLFVSLFAYIKIASFPHPLLPSIIHLPPEDKENLHPKTVTSSPCTIPCPPQFIPGLDLLLSSPSAFDPRFAREELKFIMSHTLPYIYYPLSIVM